MSKSVAMLRKGSLCKTVQLIWAIVFERMSQSTAMCGK